MELFLGYRVTEPLERALADSPPPLQAFLLQGKDYLQKIVIENLHYLGKVVPSPLSLEELERQERHLSSLLKKLLPRHPIDQYPLLVQIYLVHS